jgi:sRNA-binding protein
LAQHDTYTTTASQQRLPAAPVLLWSSLIKKPQQIEEIHKKTTRSRCQNQFTEEKKHIKVRKIYELCTGISLKYVRGRNGHDSIVVGFTTTCVISAYRH